MCQCKCHNGVKKAVGYGSGHVHQAQPGYCTLVMQSALASLCQFDTAWLVLMSQIGYNAMKCHGQNSAEQLSRDSWSHIFQCNAITC